MGQGTRHFVADNIACFINSVLQFFIKQYNTKQSSTIFRHNGFPYLQNEFSKGQRKTPSIVHISKMERGSLTGVNQSSNTGHY